MNRKSTVIFEHSYTEGEVHTEALEEVLRDELYGSLGDNIELEVVELIDEDHPYGIVIDTWQIGWIDLGDRTWRAQIEFEANFEYVLFDDDAQETPLQQILDWSKQMKDAKGTIEHHGILDCAIAIVWDGEDNCRSSVIYNAFMQAEQDVADQS